MHPLRGEQGKLELDLRCALIILHDECIDDMTGDFRGWYFTRIGQKHGEARVPAPVFGIVFLALCALNTVVPLIPALMQTYAPRANRRHHSGRQRQP